MNRIYVSEKCTACGACVQKCPHDAIEYKEDSFGFLYPEINEKCANCGACVRVCPIDKAYPETKPSVYAAVNTNIDRLMKSSSGGVFSALAEYVLSTGGVVYGASFDKDFRVTHIRVSELSELVRLQGSKYVQSNTENTFSEAKRDLNEGITVLYSGTPCQIAGLNGFLGKTYDNLITVDLICHGVPNQRFFSQYLEWLSKKQKGKITEFSFRDKEAKGWTSAGSVRIETGKSSKKKVLWPAFNYYQYYNFLSGGICRKSCYECAYAGMRRPGDYTIGDFWGAEKYLPGIKNLGKRGCSVVLCNSQKAEALIKKVTLDLKEITLSQAQSENGQLREPAKSNLRNDTLLDASDFNTAERYFKQHKKHLYKAYVKMLMPTQLKLAIKRAVYRARGGTS